MAEAPIAETVAAAAGPPPMAVQTVVEHGEASRLPDPSWGWRRVLIFLITIASLVMVARIAERSTDVVTLRMIARNSQYLIGLCLFIYGAFAGAQDIVRLVAAFRTTRRETVTTSPTGPGV